MNTNNRFQLAAKKVITDRHAINKHIQIVRSTVGCGGSGGTIVSTVAD